MAGAFVGPVSAAEAAQRLLEPGVYRLDPEAYRATTSAAPGPGESILDRYVHAVPAAARVRYAFVSRAADAALNKLVFVTDPAYRYDINSDNLLCPAYAFPGWNERSDAEPFCRTNIGANDREVALDWTATAFSLRWQDRKRLLRSEQIPPQRKPTGDEIGACAVAGVCAPAAYGSTVNYYEIVHATDGFTLQTPRDYQDVLYIAATVPTYAQPASGWATGRLRAGTYVAVISRDSEWLQVDQIDQGGAATSTWLSRDELTPAKWIVQHAETDTLRFRLAIERDADDADASADTEGGVPVAVEIRDADTGTRRQILRDFSADRIEGSADVLQLVDANFDGFPDLLIPGMSGGAGPNSTQNVFLFDPAHQRFVFDAALSGMSQLSIDAASRTVSTASRDGCCGYTSETYRYAGKALELIGSESSAMTGDGRYQEITRGTLRNGRMVYRTTRTRAEQELP